MPPQDFQLVSDHRPTGDQPAAIDALTIAIDRDEKYQTLMGVTGSGKTFTMANVIARVKKPTLVISHNKTLAAQLYEEFKELFPHNAVQYFVSYYDYYQPEAYIPQRDIYIEKDSSRNDDLDRLRLAATSALVSRRDVIVVASVSCIFGLGSPDAYRKSVISLARGQTLDRREFLLGLNSLQYTRGDIDFKRGNYRLRGDVIEVHPAGEEVAYRIEMFGDEIESLALVNPLTGELVREEPQLFIYPAVHYVLPESQVDRAVASISEELEHRVLQLRHEGKLLEAQRLQARTKYDLEMIQEVGFCSGIENYSRHLDGRPPGAKPYTLMDYFPDATSGEYQGEYLHRTPEHPEHLSAQEMAALPPALPPVPRNDGLRDWLLVIDESHVTIPQLRGMFFGDRSRKQTLVDHGFRLPSAMDNRPLRFEEIERIWPQVVFVSATPGPYELEKTAGAIVEQVIRPTGLVDPNIEVRPATNQVPDLMEAIKARTATGERTLVTTLTKRLAEDLAAYLADHGLRCRYMHSEIQTLDRIEILRDLRLGEYDVLVGVNLLREGLDLPEVSLVAIMDADKTGFLRSASSLIQTIGRAARNVNATVLLYGDSISPAMKQAMDETARRRTIQLAYNVEHNITPETIKKAIRRSIELEIKARQTVREAVDAADDLVLDRSELIAEMERLMLEAAQNLEFEKAAALRDRVKQLRDAPEMGKMTAQELKDVKKPREAPGAPGSRARRPRKKNRGEPT